MCVILSSRAQRLNVLCRGLFYLQTKYTFILSTFWLSSADNFLADDLSRGRVDHFFARVLSFLPSVALLFTRPGAGRVVTLADNPARDSSRSLRAYLRALDSDSEDVFEGDSKRSSKPRPRFRGGGGAGTRRAGNHTQRDSVQYPRASIFDGLPIDCVQRVEDMLDHRLAPGSLSRVYTALRKWDPFCAERGWPTLMETGLPTRGGRLAAWVTSLVDDTELVYSSISTYVWGVCTWHTLQHVADPTLGVDDWREFMMSVAVLTSVPSEPRRPIPMEVTRDMLEDIDWDDFEDVQFALVAIVSFFLFNRTETPCPKNFTGPQSFDPDFHWQVNDFRLRKGPRDTWVLWVRMKGFKQDRRQERPSASHAPEFVPFDTRAEGESKDWVPVGDVPGDVFSVARAYMRFTQLIGREREGAEPMFLARDKVRAYTYRCLLNDLRVHLARVDADVSLSPHGWRVEGYNRSKNANGLELTVAHGGWQSDAHDRYERFRHEAVLSIPARMVGAASSFVSEDGTREIHTARIQRGSAGPVDDAPGIGGPVDDAPEVGVPLGGVSFGDAVDSSDITAPPGFVREDRVTSAGRKYVIWRARDGKPCQSRPAAWLYHQSLREEVGDAGDSVEEYVAPEWYAVSEAAGLEPEFEEAAEASCEESPTPREFSGQDAVPCAAAGPSSLSAASPRVRRASSPRRPRPTQSRVSLEELAKFKVEFDRPPARPHPLDRSRSSHH